VSLSPHRCVRGALSAASARLWLSLARRGDQQTGRGASLGPRGRRSSAHSLLPACRRWGAGSACWQKRRPSMQFVRPATPLAPRLDRTAGTGTGRREKEEQRRRLCSASTACAISPCHSQGSAEKTASQSTTCVRDCSADRLHSSAGPKLEDCLLATPTRRHKTPEVRPGPEHAPQPQDDCVLVCPSSEVLHGPTSSGQA